MLGSNRQTAIGSYSSVRLGLVLHSMLYGRLHSTCSTARYSTVRYDLPSNVTRDSTVTQCNLSSYRCVDTFAFICHYFGRI
jgi:hypothetical protein